MQLFKISYTIRVCVKFLKRCLFQHTQCDREEYFVLLICSYFCFVCANKKTSNENTTQNLYIESWIHCRNHGSCRSSYFHYPQSRRFVNKHLKEYLEGKIILCLCSWTNIHVFIHNQSHTITSLPVQIAMVSMAIHDITIFLSNTCHGIVAISNEELDRESNENLSMSK